MLIEALIAIAVYAVVYFAIMFASFLGLSAAESLGEWLTARRLAIIGAVTAVLVASAGIIAVQVGLVRPELPNASPGFERGRSEVSAPVKAPAGAPAIKSKVKAGDSSREGESHRDKLRAFEGR